MRQSHAAAHQRSCGSGPTLGAINNWCNNFCLLSSISTLGKRKRKMAAAPAFQEIRAESYVGFDSITQQIKHKLLKRGFQFNTMPVGACRTSSLLLCVSASCRTCCFYMLIVSFCRTNRARKVDAHQHHSRIPPHRLQGPVRVGRTRQADDRDSSDLTR